MKRWGSSLIVLAILGLGGCAAAPVAPIAAYTPPPSVSQPVEPVTPTPVPVVTPEAAPATLTEAERHTLDVAFGNGYGYKSPTEDVYCPMSAGGRADRAELIGGQLDLSTDQVLLYLTEWCDQ